MVLFLSNCKKNDETVAKENTVASVYYFKATIDGVLSEAQTMGLSSLGSDLRWIVAENGNGSFSRGGIGIKIQKEYLKVGSYTLNSSSADKYVGEFYTKSNGEVDSIYSTSNTLTQGILKIDKISDNSETTLMKEISGRFAFYAVEKNSKKGITITYGEFKILAHSAFFK